VIKLLRPAALLAALLLPLAALSQQAPQVVLATPGTGNASGGAINRYSLRFSEPMVALGDPRAPSPAKMKCAIASTGRWVDTQTYVFEFERALPGGITCDIVLRDDLESAGGRAVRGTTSFKIDTGGPTARAVLGGNNDEAIEEGQVFLVATNTPATAQSVAAGAYCAVEGIGERIPVDVLGRDVATGVLADLGDDHWASRQFLENAGLPQSVSQNATERASALATVTAVKCRRPLPPGRNIALVWGKTVASADGRLAGKDERFDFTVRKAFVARWSCSRVNPQSGCNPVEDARLMFTDEVPVAAALAARVTFPDGTVLTPHLRDDDKSSATVSQVQFTAPLPAAAKGVLSLPAGLRDESGRLLANAQRFPLDVQIAAAPPLVKFAANFGIIEANDEAMLPVTVRAVEQGLGQKMKSIAGETLRVEASDGDIAKWLRDVEYHERAKSDEVPDGVDSDGEPKTKTVERTGDTPLLRSTGEAMRLDLPGKGRDFEVIGIPLKAPGFYVVELASPMLGAALLQPGKTRYVTAAALVTNMAVHFKWGRDASLAWVTTLDGAKPVVGADVRVSDSCTGRQIARGTTGADGRIALSGLPTPDSSPSNDCDEEGSHPLMVSARANGDFSFTMTAWGDGIAPYDFDLPFGWSAAGDIIHTIFDRTLAKQGETVNMKHIMRRPIGTGLAFAKGIKGRLKLTHRGSDTEFFLPLSIGADGVGENQWLIPKGAPMGTYDLSIVRAKSPDAPATEAAGGTDDDVISLAGEINVEEYKLPTMRATITGPKEALVRPQQVPLNLFVGYLSGGPAAHLPVSVRTAFEPGYGGASGWDGWQFGGSPVKEGTIPLSGNNQEPVAPLPTSQTLPLTLAGDGTSKTTIDIAQAIEQETVLDVEMDYQDANGETLTASRRVALHPSALKLGLKTDGWMMRGDDLRVKMVALDHEGHPVAGRSVHVDVYSQEVLTARRRLIGGFYAYDNQLKTTKLAASCTVSTDTLGLAGCALAPDVSGEVTLVAATTDSNGNVARSVSSVWLAGKDEWWFGGDNGDRMDVVPEAKSYKAGDTARFQVRMPFREATALVTVEREGVLSSFVTQLSGKDPVVSVKLPDSYAPNVFVSVMAVRGRVGGLKLWTAEVARDWGLPFLSQDGYKPTALVDLAKPSYRIGIAQVQVGWEGHQLGVTVAANKARYGVGETAQVSVDVKAPGGKPPASAEIAFAAVDEALLQLKGNDSWKLIDAMMGERSLSVLTSTAQTQVVGKRHYGKKAVPTGGGGGNDSGSQARQDFKPVLLWKGRVALDAKGHALIPVQLVDSLSAYRLVAVANAGSDLFGTGSTSIRTAQDLSIFAGLPPVVRTGDTYAAAFTLRNGTDKPMTVTATANVTPALAGLSPQTVMIPASGSAPIAWTVTAPDTAGQLTWDVAAKAGGKQTDRLSQTQDIVPLVPVETWASTLVRVEANTRIPVIAPAGALANRGVVDVRLSDSLAPTLAGVQDYMTVYPYRCFEQQTSRFVTLGDAQGFAALAAEIPAYLDTDGLLRYWPMSDLKGSPALTAYVLSITAEAGFPLPEESKAAMLAAMKRIIDGKLTRETQWSSNDRYLRVAALAALARNGATKAAMLGQMGITPADMPTGLLVEWLTAIDRTKGANPALRQAAETILRQRIAYEGTRLDLTDSNNAPWWMMSSGDEMAIKATLAVLGRSGWSDDDGKMMVGMAMRQRRGHWDTTTANAWGAVTARKFGKLYPASAIIGTTSIAFGGETKTQTWPRPTDAGVMSFALPISQTPLTLAHAGAGPWAFVSVKAAVPLKAPLFAGYKISKTITPVQQAQKGVWSRGDVMRVRLAIDAGAGRNWVVVNDPIPPGATILGGLGGQSQQLAGSAEGPDGAWPSYIERGNESWRGYYEWAPEGRFAVEYVVRLNGVGQFNLPATRVEAMYAPEIRGQLPNPPFSVVMR
jgi:alpha-2-macroglobulin